MIMETGKMPVLRFPTPPWADPASDIRSPTSDRLCLRLMQPVELIAAGRAVGDHESAVDHDGDVRHGGPIRSTAAKVVRGFQPEARGGGRPVELYVLGAHRGNVQ